MAGAVNAPIYKLVELVGLVAALRVIDDFGGTAIYLPHPSRVKGHSPLAQAIGLAAAKILAGEWEKTRVVIPRGRGVKRLRRRRDVAVLADCREMSVPKVARKWEMTERNVYLLLARGPEALDDPVNGARAQGDLFGENAG